MKRQKNQDFANECDTKQMRAFTTSLEQGEGSATRDVREVLTALCKADGKGLTKFEYATKYCGETEATYDSSGSYNRFAPRVCVTLCFNGYAVCEPNETGPGRLRYFSTITADQIEDCIADLIVNGKNRPKDYKHGAQAHGSESTDLYQQVTRPLHAVAGLTIQQAQANVKNLPRIAKRKTSKKATTKS